MAVIQPILDRIVVQKTETAKQTESGLFIPDTSSERPDRGVVVAAGPGRPDKNGEVKPLQVKAGDLVIFAKNVGQEAKVDGETYTIMAEADVLAIIK